MGDNLQAALSTVAPALPGGPVGAEAQALAMESMFEDDISILTQEALGPSEVWLDAPGDPSLGGDMCSASHFALITAYGDIKERLGGLERENATLRRRLKVYEIKYPLINDFGEEHGFSLYEIKDGSLLEMEKVSLQQRLNQFQHELQKNKEQEEQLGEMIQAYEKLCVEKSDLETELGEMRALVETHLRQICGLEQQLRQQQGLRDAAFPSPSPPPAPAPPCTDLDLHYLALRGGSGLSHAGWPGPTPSVSELERRRLEEALEAAQGEARGAQLREEQLQAECERLQGELKQLQESRAQDLASNQSERDMAWVKRVGDDHPSSFFHLVQTLQASGNFTCGLSQERNAGLGYPDRAQHLVAGAQGTDCPRRRAAGGQSGAKSKDEGGEAVETSLLLRMCREHPTTPRARAPPLGGDPTRVAESLPATLLQLSSNFHEALESLLDLGQGRLASSLDWAGAGVSFRVNLALAYTELTEELGRLRELSSLQGRILRTLLQEQAATLPKPRAYGGELYGPGRPLSPRRAFEGIRLRFEKQPSEEEEWAVPTSPPSPEAGTIRCASFCAGFPIPESPAATAYAHAEHAQSWPSINLLMETVGSDIRSCPLCQLGFPVGYPDDALIKHIDSHLENSKI
ncbi:TANK-binding kinase 1-binding protein 1 [Puma concolor]|uniref:TANK-binding kinase 1-binding protein 1 n=1 Tax=Puma concolor TaxID=9696 RepID=A0A6P6HBX3_PUMCO|nr:TANK-binding kinase 1-binding protein 1 [Puma concolor]